MTTSPLPSQGETGRALPASLAAMLDELVSGYAGRAVARLVEELLECYADWRSAAAAADRAYHGWSAAPDAHRAQSFSVYTAALDQEEAAAMSYTLAVWDVERWVRNVR